MGSENDIINAAFKQSGQQPSAGQISGQDISQMFSSGSASIEQIAAELATFIVIEEAKCDQLEAELKERKARAEEAKTQLATKLLAANLESIKVKGGLCPSAKNVRKYFKQSGIEDDMMFGWLRDNELGGIIKPYVHFQTLQSTLRTFEEQGHVISPVIFNVTDVPTIRLNGKSKFLASLAAQQFEGK